MINRRWFVGWALGLPFLSSLVAARQLALPQPVPEYGVSPVGVLRFLIKCQYLYKAAFGSFGDLNTLTSSSGVEELRNNPRAERYRIGRTFLEAVNLGSAEMIPGWVVDHNLSPDRNHFSIVISELGLEPRSAFSTDERAVVYKGSITGPVLLNKALNAKDALSVPKELSSKSSVSALGRAVSMLAFAFLPMDECPKCCEGSFECCYPDECTNFDCGGCMPTGCATFMWCCCCRPPGSC